MVVVFVFVVEVVVNDGIDRRGRDGKERGTEGGRGFGDLGGKGLGELGSEGRRGEGNVEVEGMLD